MNISNINHEGFFHKNSNTGIEEFCTNEAYFINAKQFETERNLNVDNLNIFSNSEVLSSTLLIEGETTAEDSESETKNDVLYPSLMESIKKTVSDLGNEIVAPLPAKPPQAAYCLPHGGILTQWHSDCLKVCLLSGKGHIFEKKRKGGAISLVYEKRLRKRGIHGYKYEIIRGEISASDGIGFVFADRVPCTKNVRNIWSIFLNRLGHVCLREGNHISKLDTSSLVALTVGNQISIVVNLNNFTAFFQVVDGNKEVYQTTVCFASTAQLVDCSKGYFCAVVTSSGVQVSIDEASVYAVNYPNVFGCLKRRKVPSLNILNLMPHPLNVLVPTDRFFTNPKEIWELAANINPHFTSAVVSLLNLHNISSSEKIYISPQLLDYICSIFFSDSGFQFHHKVKKLRKKAMLF